LTHGKKYVKNGKRPSAEIVDVYFSVWKHQDIVNRHNANRTSFELYGFAALIPGGARQRLAKETHLQDQVNEMRALFNLNPIY
jgi:hypothetical protein